MLLSLNWLRDFVDLPDELDPHRLAERLTMVTCEVEGVERVRVRADGLLVAEVLTCEAIAGTRDLWCVELDAGGKTLTTVSAAPDLAVGKKLIYAPPGATLPHIGKIGRTEVATVQGSKLLIEKKRDGSVTINGANVASADVLAGNGVIHVIDAVVTPEQS